METIGYNENILSISFIHSKNPCHHPPMSNQGQLGLAVRLDSFGPQSHKLIRDVVLGGFTEPPSARLFGINVIYCFGKKAMAF